jgi:hypothetical protein
MNQVGFVEVAKIVNEVVYRLQLPMGVKWTEVQSVLESYLEDVKAHIQDIESKAAEAQAPIEAQVEEVPEEKPVSRKAKGPKK